MEGAWVEPGGVALVVPEKELGEESYVLDLELLLRSGNPNITLAYACQFGCRS